MTNPLKRIPKDDRDTIRKTAITCGTVAVFGGLVQGALLGISGALSNGK